MGFLLSPYGRVSRRGFYLGFVLVFAVLFAGAWFGDRAIMASQAFVLPPALEPLQFAFDLLGGPLMLALCIIFPWVLIVTVIKRLHDRGFGGGVIFWKALVIALLIFAALTQAQKWIPGDGGTLLGLAMLVIAGLMILRVLVIVLFLGGQDGANRFGDDPLERR